MTKTIAILGAKDNSTAALAHSLTDLGYAVMIGEKPTYTPSRKQYKPLNLSGFINPINSYQTKQRKRKMRKKGVL